MKKFIKLKYLVIASIFTIIVAGETAFNAWAYSRIFAVIESQSTNNIVYYIIFVLFGYLFFSIVSYVETLLTNKSIKETNKILKETLLSKIISRGKIRNENNISDNISFFLNDLKLLEDSYFSQYFKCLKYLSAIILTFLFSIQNDFYLTILFLIFSSITPFLTNLFKKRIELTNQLWTFENKNFSSLLKDILQGITTIKNYSVEKETLDKFKTSNHQLESRNEHRKNTLSLSNSVTMIIAYIFMYIPIGIGMYFVVNGNILLSSFIAVQYSSSWIVNNFLAVSQSLNIMNSTGEIRKRIEVILEIKEETSTMVLNKELIKSIEFKNVSFKYEDKEVFNGVNFKVNIGDRILIQGPSGSGKSTLLKLITKELSPSSGNIYINGKDINTIGKKELMSNIGIVTQNIMIFNDTILENITLRKKFSKEKIEEALSKAGLKELIKNYGLDYQIGEEGQALSGGQLKRIEIARAILFNRPILLIDEGNASLDKNTAIQINNVLSKLDKMIIDIEHYIPKETTSNYNQRYVVSERGIHLYSS